MRYKVDALSSKPIRIFSGFKSLWIYPFSCNTSILCKSWSASSKTVFNENFLPQKTYRSSKLGPNISMTIIWKGPSFPNQIISGNPTIFKKYKFFRILTLIFELQKKFSFLNYKWFFRFSLFEFDSNISVSLQISRHINLSKWTTSYKSVHFKSASDSYFV